MPPAWIPPGAPAPPPGTPRKPHTGRPSGETGGGAAAPLASAVSRARWTAQRLPLRARRARLDAGDLKPWWVRRWRLRRHTGAADQCQRQGARQLHHCHDEELYDTNYYFVKPTADRGRRRATLPAR